MATKENNSNALSEDSPLKKRLRSRKEGAGLEVMGSQLAKEKSGCRPLAEVKEKRLEVLKANTAAFNCTEKYYTESQKKIEVFMGEDRPDSKENAVKPSAAPEEAAGNEEIVGKARPRSNLRTSAALAAPPPSHHENAPDLLKPTPELIESTSPSPDNLFARTPFRGDGRALSLFGSKRNGRVRGADDTHALRGAAADPQRDHRLPASHGTRAREEGLRPLQAASWRSAPA